MQRRVKRRAPRWLAYADPIVAALAAIAARHIAGVVEIAASTGCQRMLWRRVKQWRGQQPAAALTAELSFLYLGSTAVVSGRSWVLA